MTTYYSAWIYRRAALASEDGPASETQQPGRLQRLSTALSSVLFSLRKCTLALALRHSVIPVPLAERTCYPKRNFNEMISVIRGHPVGRRDHGAPAGLNNVRESHVVYSEHF